MNESSTIKVFIFGAFYSLILAEIKEHQQLYQQLYRDKDEKFNKMYLKLAADKEAVTMERDKYVRAVLRLTEECKKRAQREAKLKKYIKKIKQGFMFTSNSNELGAVEGEDQDDSDDFYSPTIDPILADLDTLSDGNLGKTKMLQKLMW